MWVDEWRSGYVDSKFYDITGPRRRTFGLNTLSLPSIVLTGVIPKLDVFMICSDSLGIKIYKY
jgi:hypothetical protein